MLNGNNKFIIKYDINKLFKSNNNKPKFNEFIIKNKHKIINYYNLNLNKSILCNNYQNIDFNRNNQNNIKNNNLINLNNNNKYIYKIIKKIIHFERNKKFIYIFK